MTEICCKKMAEQFSIISQEPGYMFVDDVGCVFIIEYGGHRLSKISHCPWCGGEIDKAITRKYFVEKK